MTESNAGFQDLFRLGGAALAGAHLLNHGDRDHAESVRRVSASMS